jgi:DNA-directed RNA polymerase subunit omega
MARITVEDCQSRIPNIFEMVRVAAKRARRVAHGADTMVEPENDKPTVIALREIAAGHVTPAILDEIEQPVVEEFMQTETTEEVMPMPMRGISIGDR